MRRATATVLVLAALAAACGGDDPLSAEELSAELATICDKATVDLGVTFASEPDELRAQAFDLFDPLREAISSFDDLRAPAEAEADVTALREGVDDILGHLSDVRTALELREFDDAAAGLRDVTEAQSQVDAAADALGEPDCGSSTWAAGWFAKAEEITAEEEAASAPTGDYDADVAAACARFGADIADVPLFLPSVVDIQLAAGSYSQAFDLLGRDLAALDPPEEVARDHAALVAALEEASDVMTSVLSSVASADDERLAALQADISDSLTAVDAGFTALGISC